MPKQEISPEEISKLNVDQISFRKRGWGNDSKWYCEAQLSVSNPKSTYSINVGTKRLEIELDDKIAEKLLACILPFVIQSASESAQKLADEAKAMANAMSQRLLEQINSDSEPKA